MKNLIAVLFCLVSAPAWAVDCVVAQYGNAQESLDGEVVQVAGRPTANNIVVTFTSSSTASVTFASQTRYIGIICTAKAHFEIAASPIATTNHLWVPADTMLFLGVWQTGLKIAFVQG